jgi:hypothetical protein
MHTSPASTPASLATGPPPVPLVVLLVVVLVLVVDPPPDPPLPSVTSPSQPGAIRSNAAKGTDAKACFMRRAGLHGACLDVDAGFDEIAPRTATRMVARHARR